MDDQTGISGLRTKIVFSLRGRNCRTMKMIFALPAPPDECFLRESRHIEKGTGESKFSFLRVDNI